MDEQDRRRKRGRKLGEIMETENLSSLPPLGPRAVDWGRRKLQHLGTLVSPKDHAMILAEVP